MAIKNKITLLALTGILAAHCGTSVTNPAPSPSAAPVVAAFTTTSGTAIGTTGTTDVPIASAFSITFSTAMTTSTLNTTTLTLSCSSTSQTVTVATVGNNSATVTPSSSMPEGATCVFTATTGVQSAGGVAMASAATFTFTTAASVPTVSSVTGTSLSSGSSTTIATTGTTGISGATAAPLTVTFSTAMSSSTVTSGMTMACPSGTSRTVTNAASSTTAFTVTPSAALPQMTSCVLSLPATIQASNGASLTATSYTYQTGCGTSDDFSNSATFSNSSTICWTPANASNASTFAISDGSLVIASGTSTTQMTAPSATKTFPAGTNSITITALIGYSGLSEAGDRCTVQVFASQTNMASATVQFNEGSVQVNGNASNGSGGEVDGNAASPATPVYLRIVISGGTSTISYSSNGTTFINLVTTGVFTTPSGTVDVSLLNRSDGTSTTTCSFQDFSVSGATATGQYSN